MTDHTHKFKTTTKQNILQCSCDTVTTLDELLKKVAIASAKQTKVSIIGRMLFNRELKKAAHDKYYAEVMAENGKVGDLEQASLL